MSARLRFCNIEISIHTSGIFEIKVLNSVMYVETSKMKLLGIKYWGIMIPHIIQPQEYSRGGDKDDILYNRTEFQREPQLSGPG